MRKSAKKVNDEQGRFPRKLAEEASLEAMFRWGEKWLFRHVSQKPG